MNRLQRMVCRVFGYCPVPDGEHPLIQQLQHNTAIAARIEQDARQIQESGIWPRDMVTGAYTPHHPIAKRRVRRDHI